MYQPDKSQVDALRTWYSVDNPLHFDPRHPCIKLAGEAGEILDLYGKEEYKPNFSWWKCKKCGFIPIDKGRQQDYVAYTCFNGERQHASLILDELGDYSYYLRILAYQKEVTFEELCKNCNANSFSHISIDVLLSELNMNSAKVLGVFVASNYVYEEGLQTCTYYLLAILAKLNTPLSQVLELNYKKLNSEETAHGWKNATVKNRS